MYVPHDAAHTTGNLAHLIGGIAYRNPSWFVSRKCVFNERVVISGDIALEGEVCKEVMKFAGSRHGSNGLADMLLKHLAPDHTFKQAEAAWVVSTLLSTSEGRVRS